MFWFSKLKDKCSTEQTSWPFGNYYAKWSPCVWRISLHGPQRPQTHNCPALPQPPEWENDHSASCLVSLLLLFYCFRLAFVCLCWYCRMWPPLVICWHVFGETKTHITIAQPNITLLAKAFLWGKYIYTWLWPSGSGLRKGLLCYCLFVCILFGWVFFSVCLLPYFVDSIWIHEISRKIISHMSLSVPNPSLIIRK